jgi:hypothetical protein
VELFLQITLGVFLGSVSSRLLLDVWHSHREATTKAATKNVRREQEMVRQVQDQHIQALLKQTQNAPQPESDSPLDFAPDDRQYRRSDSIQTSRKISP